jgi:hypothetical protein
MRYFEFQVTHDNKGIGNLWNRNKRMIISMECSCIGPDIPPHGTVYERKDSCKKILKRRKFLRSSRVNNSQWISQKM